MCPDRAYPAILMDAQVKHRKHESAQSQESKGLLAAIGGSIGGPRFIEKDDVGFILSR